ncbi:hypothetical protein HPB50_013884 [Hyalomma asiaticum]|uniref:Uncharacterized protein n=1 Tax=Hyalomma asiaticum TaxID=266040 RepID=A0ACB7SHP6_HYAAI|nr:hypothetical protein HPB50_013884 [Hyalomma asiaticum]
MGSSEDEEPEEAEKSKECLAAHGYTVGKTLGAGSYSTVKDGYEAQPVVSNHRPTAPDPLAQGREACLRVRPCCRRGHIRGYTGHPLLPKAPLHVTPIEFPSRVNRRASLSKPVGLCIAETPTFAGGLSEEAE